MHTVSYILPFITSTILGFFLSNYFARKHDGEKLEWSFRFRLGQYRVHIHHWMWSLMITVVCLAFEIYDPIVLGFLAGSIIQGLTYRDWWVIVYKAKDFRRIYSKILGE